MPDLLPGTRVRGLDTPPTVQNAQSGTYNFTITAYGVAASSGTHVACGTAFVAPTSGRVKITHVGFIRNGSAGNGALISPVVRTGGTVGSGTVVKAADDVDCIQVNGNGSGTDGVRAGSSVVVGGLTPGDTYNVRLEHRVTPGGTGTATRRTVIVEPCT